jgi:outer membrane protein OmpA-like peptidoglycan-associated protein
VNVSTVFATSTFKEPSMNKSPSLAIALHTLPSPMNRGMRGTARALLLTLVASSIALGGCANMSETQRGTATGAGAGAVGGALLGVIAGDSGRAAGRGAVVGSALGAIGGYVWSKRMEDQRAKLAAATQGTGVSVSQTADNRLKLDIPSDISFDVGRSVIKSNFQPVLDQFATTLRDNSNTEVRIVGHTDSTGSDAVNNPLSVDRAASARDYLVSRGVSAQRVQIEGRGSREPISSNETDAGRARNRRVEIFVGERESVAQAPQAPQAPAQPIGTR